MREDAGRLRLPGVDGLTYAAGHSAHNMLLRVLAPVVLRRPFRSAAVLGSGRSGTTAFMNMAAAGLEAEPIFEPLRPESSTRVRRLAPRHGYLDVAREDSAPELANYLSEVFRGRSLTRWSTSQTSLQRLRTANTLVVKFVRANRICGWLQEHFPAVPIAVLVRHPLDVVESMMAASQGWSRVPYQDLVPPAAAAIGCTPADLCGPGDDPYLWLFSVWLADTFCVRRDFRLGQMHHVFYYEDLSTRPDCVVSRYASGFAQFDVEAACVALGRPSATTGDSVVHEASRRPLGPNLSLGTKARIRHLLKCLDIESYSLSSRALETPLLEG